MYFLQHIRFQKCKQYSKRLWRLCARCVCLGYRFIIGIYHAAQSKLKQTKQIPPVSTLWVTQSNALFNLLVQAHYQKNESVDSSIVVSHWSLKQQAFTVLTLLEPIQWQAKQKKAMRAVLHQQTVGTVLFFIDLHQDISAQLRCFDLLCKHNKFHSSVLIHYVVQVATASFEQVYIKFDFSKWDIGLLALQQNLLWGNGSKYETTWNSLLSFYKLIDLANLLCNRCCVQSLILLSNADSLQNYVQSLMTEQTSTGCHTKIPKYASEFWCMSAMCLSFLSFSLISYCSYQSEHKASHILRKQLMQQHMKNVLPLYIKSQQQLQHHIYNFMPMQTRLVHLIKDIYRVLIPMKQGEAMVTACVAVCQQSLDKIQLDDMLTLAVQQKLKMDALSSIWLNYHRTHDVLKCVKVLDSLHHKHPTSEQALQHSIDAYYDQHWLQWFLKLRWQVPLNLADVPMIWSHLLGADGDIYKLLTLLFDNVSTAHMPIQFKNSRLKTLAIFKHRETEYNLRQYWKSLAILETKMKWLAQYPESAELLQEVVSILHDAKHPLQQARQASERLVVDMDDQSLKEISLKLLQLPLLAWWQSLLAASRIQLQHIWDTTVWLAWQQDLKNYFPFTVSSVDASSEAVRHMFEPHVGLFDQYVESYLTPLLQKNSWRACRFLGQGLLLQPQAITKLLRIQQWQSVWFNKQHNLTMMWQIQPLLQPQLDSWILNSNGQRIVYHNGPPRWYALQLPNQEAWSDTSLILIGYNKTRTQLTTAGPWGLWRLVQRAHIKPVSPQLYKLSWYFDHEDIKITQALLKINGSEEFRFLQQLSIAFPRSLFV